MSQTHPGKNMDFSSLDHLSSNSKCATSSWGDLGQFIHTLWVLVTISIKRTHHTSWLGQLIEYKCRWRAQSSATDGREGLRKHAPLLIKHPNKGIRILEYRLQRSEYPTGTSRWPSWSHLGAWASLHGDKINLSTHFVPLCPETWARLLEKDSNC
jgi:hypothetical protein